MFQLHIAVQIEHCASYNRLLVLVPFVLTKILSLPNTEFAFPTPIIISYSLTPVSVTLPKYQKFSTPSILSLLLISRQLVDIF